MHWGRKFFLPQFYGTVCVEITFYLCLLSFLSSRFRERIKTCESDDSFPLGIPHLLCFSPLNTEVPLLSLWGGFPARLAGQALHICQDHISGPRIFSGFGNISPPGGVVFSLRTHCPLQTWVLSYMVCLFLLVHLPSFNRGSFI